MEKIAAWVLGTFGPWAATVLCLGAVIWWLLKDRKSLLKELKTQRAENLELREKYSKTLLGVSYRQGQVISMLASERANERRRA